MSWMQIITIIFVNVILLVSLYIISVTLFYNLAIKGEKIIYVNNENMLLTPEETKCYLEIIDFEKDCLTVSKKYNCEFKCDGMKLDFEVQYRLDKLKKQIGNRLIEEYKKNN